MAQSTPSETPSVVNRIRVLSLESRRSEEMRSLIERNGGDAFVAPSMREVPIEENAEVFRFFEELLAGRIDVLVFLTGVGANALMETLEARFARQDILVAMQRCVVVVRGPKPAAILGKWGLRIDQRVPEPNTWRELITTLDLAYPPSSSNSLNQKTIAIQEYGKPNDFLYAELSSRGANVLAVPVYRWALPMDVQPLRDAIQRTIDGGFDVILFTSAQQFHNILAVAEEQHLAQRWLSAAKRIVIASIGPTATETLVEGGLNVDVQPTHPKMGPLVKESMEAAQAILERKRLCENSD